MPTSDAIKAALFDRPEHIPVTVSILPATWMKYREQVDDLVARHPVVFGGEQPYQRDYDAVDGTYAEGEHTDEWGCVWLNIAHGLNSMVKRHPVPTRADVHRLRAPEIVDGRMPHGFMYLRLPDLRGFDEIMLDFAEEPPELQMLIDVVLDYNLRNLEVLLKGHTGPTIWFGDDLGMQTSLPISPGKWRKYLKPCFAKMYARCREEDLIVFMHTDGHIIEIIPDLIDCGVQVVNPQVRANGLDGLAAVCKGKVCVYLDLDRQMFPFATPAEIDDHVREAVETLGSPEGGLMLVAECAPDVPLDTIEAICVALEKYRSHYS